MTYRPPHEFTADDVVVIDGRRYGQTDGSHVRLCDAPIYAGGQGTVLCRRAAEFTVLVPHPDESIESITRRGARCATHRIDLDGYVAVHGGKVVPY